MKYALDCLPRCIVLDSCTVQTVRNYGGYIYESEPICDPDRICRVTQGIATIASVGDIFSVNERAQPEWCATAAPRLGVG